MDGEVEAHGIYSVLMPRVVEVKNARKVSFWVSEDMVLHDGDTMKPLDVARHDYVVYERRLDRAKKAGVTGMKLTLLTRQRDYKRKVYLKLKG
jgi:hypothetical protein